MSTVTLTPEQYWKFRAQESERGRLEERAQNVLRQIEIARNAAFKELDLDVAQSYQFDDATYTIKPIESSKP